MRRHLTALALTAALLTGMSGCGGADRTAQAGPTPAPVSDQPASAFELYLLASAENNILFADVYALRLPGLELHRLTAGKRISTMDAGAAHVAVAAADGDVDRLGYLGTGGEIVEIPGLGRPYAFRPRFGPAGEMFYSDYYPAPDRSDAYRYFRYSSATAKATKLLDSKKDLTGPTPLPGGKLGYAIYGKHPILYVKAGSRTLRKIPLPRLATTVTAGKRWTSVALVSADSDFGENSVGMLLVDVATGRKVEVPGWDPITWTPDGTKLLVRRTGSTTDSELALLDPDHPTAIPEALGTIPNLVIYSGAWVKRN